MVRWERVARDRVQSENEPQKMSLKFVFRKKSSLYLFISFLRTSSSWLLPSCASFSPITSLLGLALLDSFICSFFRSFGIKLDNQHYFKSKIVEDEKQQCCRHSVVCFRGSGCSIIVVVV